MTGLLTDDPWRLLIEALPEGAVLTDGASPAATVLYANPAFERLTGYAAEELVGHSLPLAGVPGCDPGGGAAAHEGAGAAGATHAIMRAVHRDGSALLLEVHSAPVTGPEGRVTHWASVFRRPEARAATQPAPRGAWLRPAAERDALTGLASREALEALLQEPPAQDADRGGPAVAVFVVDVDDLAGYNGTFGRAAGDAMLKRVAAALGAAFRRSSDVLARWEGGTFAALAQGLDAGQAGQHAEALRKRVRDLCIHHPHSRLGKFVSVTVSVAVAPARDVPALEAALARALDSQHGAKAAAQPALAAPCGA